MADSSKKRLKHSAYTVAIICPLEVEMAAVRYMLDEEHARLPNKDGDSNRYIFGAMSGHNVVIGYLPYGSQGIGAAATVAINMKRTFPTIELRLLVGIGGGVPSQRNDVRLGDVVVGMPEGIHGGVVQYDLGKETTAGFERKGFLEPPPKEWRNAIVEMKVDHRARDNRIAEFLSEMVQRYPRLSEYQSPGAEKDILFQPSNTHVSGQMCEKCDLERVVERSARPSGIPSIFYGLIASGDRVMKNAEVRDKISADLGGVLCFEMEAAGLMHDFQCVAIRGIADYSDSHKNDEWHAYGAAVAAGCAKELLTYMVPIVESRPATYSNVPNQQVKNFVGREEELSQITAFFSRDSDRPRIFILHALGGQGKSQIALEYCRQANTTYTGVFWVNSSSESTLSQSFVSIAEMIDAAATVSLNEGEKAQFVLRNLAGWEDRWLMVFDNCDDPTVFPRIQDLIPAGGRGNILFTSRHRGLERLGDVLDIPPLPTTDGVDLLLRRFRGIHQDDYKLEASRIVDRLGGLALAIDQAGAYIQYCQLGVERLAEFLDIYEKQRKKILEHTPGDFWEYGAMHIDRAAQEKAVSAFTTWEMSFLQLCEKEAERSTAVAHFFTLSAFLAPIVVDEWLFRHLWEFADSLPPWISIFAATKSCDSDESEDDEDDKDNEEAVAGADSDLGSAPNPPASLDAISETANNLRIGSRWDHDQFWRLVSRAHQMSLVQEAAPASPAKDVAFSLHPLIRDWLQLRERGRRRQELTRECIDMIVLSIRVVDALGDNARVKQSLLLHMDASIRNDAEFFKAGCRLGEEMSSCQQAQWFAGFYRNQGKYDLSFRLETVAYRTRVGVLGAEHTSTLTSMHNLAIVLVGQGRYNEAEAMYREVVEIRQKILQAEHPDALTSMNNLATVLTDQGKYNEAEMIHKRVVEIRQKVLGVEHPDTLISMNNLAAVLSSQGKYNEAEMIHKPVMEISQKVLGVEHPDTLASMNNLATGLGDQGKYNEAEVIHKRVMEISQKVLGVEHPNTLTSMGNLATVLGCQGKYNEAEVIHKRVMEIRQRILGAEHPDRLTSMNNLATVLIDQGKYEEAEPLQVAAVTMSVNAFGPHHPNTKAIFLNLIYLWKSQGLGDSEIMNKLHSLFSI